MPCGTASSAPRAGDAAQRTGDPGLVAGALASPGKKAVDEGRTIVWVDQSRFYLLPLAVRTGAPCGQTPLLRVPLTHAQLAAISGITPDGRLFMQTQEHAYHSPDVVRFLRVLLRKIAGKLLIIGTGRPSIAASPSKSSCAKVLANACTWSSCPAMRLSLIRTRGSGATSSGSSWATVVVLTCPRLPSQCAVPRSACATSAGSFRRVFDRQATTCRPSCRRHQCNANANARFA